EGFFQVVQDRLRDTGGADGVFNGLCLDFQVDLAVALAGKGQRLLQRRNTLRDAWVAAGVEGMQLVEAHHGDLARSVRCAVYHGVMDDDEAIITAAPEVALDTVGAKVVGDGES